VWRDEIGLEAAVGSRFAAAAGPVCGARGLPAAVEPAAALSQRLLRAGFRDPVGHDPAAHRAHAGKKFSAARSATVSAAGGGRGGGVAGGVFWARLDPGGGGGGGEA